LRRLARRRKFLFLPFLFKEKRKEKKKRKLTAPSSRTYPQPATDVTYTAIPSLTKANATHWTYTAVAKGASAFGTSKLDPTSKSVSFAYAQAGSAPTEPTNPSSRFSIHQSRGKFTADLAGAKIADFAALVAKLTAK